MAPSRHDHALKIPVRHQIANTQTYKLFISQSRNFFATKLCVWYLLRHGRLNNFLRPPPNHPPPTTFFFWIYMTFSASRNCWGEIEKRHTIQMCWKLTSFIFREQKEKLNHSNLRNFVIYIFLIHNFFLFTKQH